MFSTFQLKRDTKNKNIEKKVVDMDNENKALQDEINDVKQATEHQISLLEEEISSLKANIKSQERNHSSHLEALKEKLDSNN